MGHSASSSAAAIACALLLAACGGQTAGERTGDSANTGADNPLLNSDVRPEPVSVTGCLTASNGRYVVTALTSEPAVPTTMTYQLTGGDESELQKQVNREVRVTGEAEPARVAEVRDIGTPAVGTSGTGAGRSDQPQPEVKTQEAVRFEARTLKVSSVTPTGDECPAGAPEDGVR